MSIAQPCGPLHQPGKSFTCSFCDFTVPYEVFGRSLYAQGGQKAAIIFLEDCYLRQDPFSTREARPLQLGGCCSVCGRDICASCSLFYTRRFCTACAQQHRQAFPSQVLQAESKVFGA